MKHEAGVRFWTPYVFIAGPIAWFGLILAQATNRRAWQKSQLHPALALVCIAGSLDLPLKSLFGKDSMISNVFPTFE